MPPRPTRESSSYLPSVSPSRTRSPVVMYPPPSSGDTNSLDIVAKERLPTKIRPSSSDWRTTNDRALGRDLGQEGEATGWHARARSATLLFEFARRIAVSEVIERTNPRKILGQHLH